MIVVANSTLCFQSSLSTRARAPSAVSEKHQTHHKLTNNWIMIADTYLTQTLHQQNQTYIAREVKIVVQQFMTFHVYDRGLLQNYNTVDSELRKKQLANLVPLCRSSSRLSGLRAKWRIRVEPLIFSGMFSYNSSM